MRIFWFQKDEKALHQLQSTAVYDRETANRNLSTISGKFQNQPKTSDF